MLEDGFCSVRYSAILGNLRDRGYLSHEDVEKLLKDYVTAQRVILAAISDEKAKIVQEALIDNYNRLKS
ncbi:hypothetical protein LX92_01898 [Maribacter polysiphoniae]|nr:hypothetical protein LX92_01898 [Maribacter polysiphoniae]